MNLIEVIELIESAPETDINSILISGLTRLVSEGKHKEFCEEFIKKDKNIAEEICYGLDDLLE